ncbi:MAG: DUF547 domain-containing protein [Candidatus Eisenbacteria bacterium]
MLRPFWFLLATLLLAWAPAVRAAAFSHAALDTVLKAHVHDARVDYGALARDRGPLERYLKATRAVHPNTWPRNEQIVFWVNVYNARVLDGVVRRPGLKSVLDVGKLIGVPTLGFFREKAVSGGHKISLNDIEHEVLRKGFHEPRIHFVLNCASASCPPLPPRALEAATLDSTLDAAARAFLLDRSKNQIAPGAELKLSSIFKWYRSDFETAAGSLQAFVQRYWRGAGVVRADAPIKFLDYDWSLNGDW